MQLQTLHAMQSSENDIGKAAFFAQNCLRFSRKKFKESEEIDRVRTKPLVWHVDGSVKSSMHLPVKQQ